MARKKLKDEPKIPIYKPEIGEAPGKVDKEGLEDFVPERINEIMEDGVVHTELDREIVIQRVAKDLYSSSTSAVRELLANEFTAARAAMAKGMEPEIHVYYDEDERRLTIEGVNTIGISQDVFTDALRWLGRSANLEGTASGQFGFGFYSYLMISDSILVKTYPVGEKPYSFYVQQALQFEFLPPPKMSKPGTQTIVVLKENISVSDIMRKIIQCARYQPFPVFTHGFGQDKVKKKGTLRSMISPKKEALESFRDDEKMDYTIEIDTPDFYYFGAWHSESGWYVGRGGYKPLHLVGIPAGEASCPSMGARYQFINIKDERKYKPTADRDRMTEDAIDKLRVVIDNSIMRELISRYDYKDGTVPTTKQIFNMKLIHWLHRNGDCEAKLLDHPVVQKVSEYAEMEVVYELGSHGYYRSNINFFDLRSDKLKIARGSNPEEFDEVGVKIPCVIKESDQDERVIKKLKRHKLLHGVYGCTDVFFDFCLSLGMNDGSKLMEGFQTKPNQSFVVHKPNGNGKDFAYRASFEGIDDEHTILFLKSDGITKILELNRIYAEHPYLLATVPSKKRMVDFDKAVWVNDFVEGCDEKEYATSKGKVKGVDLISKEKIVLMAVPWMNDKLAQAFEKTQVDEGEDKILIVEDKDEIIRLYLYLMMNRKKDMNKPVITTGSDIFKADFDSPDKAMDYHYTYQTYGLYRNHVLDSACLYYIHLLHADGVLKKDFANSLLALYRRYPMNEIVKHLLIDKQYVSEEEVESYTEDEGD